MSYEIISFSRDIRPYFYEMARQEPEKLEGILSLQNQSMPVGELMVVAEVYGSCCLDRDVPEFLLPLIHNAHQWVRIGAIYGLAHHLHNREVLACTQILSEMDQDEGVRTAAVNVLTWLHSGNEAPFLPPKVWVK